MDAKRIKQIKREARKAVGAELHRLFFEVYGADFAGAVSDDRARSSIIEAVTELMQKNPRNTGQEQIMEELIKQMIAEQKITNVILGNLLAAFDENGGGKKRGKRPSTELYIDGKGKPEAPVAEPKKPEVVDTTEGVTIKNNPTVDQGSPAPEKSKITIEQLREMASKYSAAFKMEDLLDLNMKLGGAKKLSAIPPENYEVLYNEMKGRLERENGKKATTTTAAPATEITVETIKAAADAFMQKNGQPALIALLKAFGADKLTNAKPDARKPLDPSKYAAFLEAVSNS